MEWERPDDAIRDMRPTTKFVAGLRETGGQSPARVPTETESAIVDEFVKSLDDAARRTLRLWMLYVSTSTPETQAEAIRQLGVGMLERERTAAEGA